MKNKKGRPIYGNGMRKLSDLQNITKAEVQAYKNRRAEAKKRKQIYAAHKI